MKKLLIAALVVCVSVAAAHADPKPGGISAWLQKLPAPAPGYAWTGYTAGSKVCSGKIVPDMDHCTPKANGQVTCPGKCVPK